MESKLQMRVAVAHLEARRYYALPRVFFEENILCSFHTGVYIRSPSVRYVLGWAEKTGIKSVAGLKGRFHPGLKGAPIEDYKLLGFAHKLRRKRVRSGEERLFNLRVFRNFGRNIVRKGMGNPNVVYSLPGEALEIFESVGEKGTKILDQNLVHFRYLERILNEECENWPRWGGGSFFKGGEDLLTEREEKEAGVADAIFCPSQFVARSMAAEGVSQDKIRVVPYPTDLDAFFPIQRKRSRGPLKVLFLGKIGLRKGAHYLLEAANRLGKTAVQVKAVGEIGVPVEELSLYKGVAEFPGRVPRNRVQDEMAWADVLCLPSLGEGQSLATNEALASGLPVVCTENTGSRVRDGVDGTIVPVRDVEALALALERYATDDEFLAWQSEQAISGRGRLGYSAYREVLMEEVQECFMRKQMLIG